LSRADTTRRHGLAPRPAEAEARASRWLDGRGRYRECARRREALLTEVRKALIMKTPAVIAFGMLGILTGCNDRNPVVQAGRLSLQLLEKLGPEEDRLYEREHERNLAHYERRFGRAARIRLEAEEAKGGYWTGNTKPLSTTLEEAGIHISYQAAGGLYFQLTPESAEILQRYPQAANDVTTFTVKGHKWCEVHRQ
jgi:hypothetical protein